MDKIFQCMTNERHVFASEPKQMLCPKCPSDEFSFVAPRLKGESGFEDLVKLLKTKEKPEEKSNEFDKWLQYAEQYILDKEYDEAIKALNNALELNIDNDKVNDLLKKAEEEKIKYLENLKERKTPSIPKVDGDEVGLGILIMDVSDSMNQPAFEGTKITRLEMVAKSAAYGVFGLKGMTEPQFSFLHFYKYDHEVTPFLFDNIAHLIERFGTPENFEKYLLEELSKRNGQTDINTALKMAYSEVNQFIKGNFKLLGNYSVKANSVLQYNDEVATIPNVRVLLYTDGLQYVNGKQDEIKNPFANPSDGMFNVLMGAFIGNEKARGKKMLEDVIGMCPMHNEKQFFLIDKPDKMKTFKDLFKMASGPSGFCPSCLGNNVHKDLME